MSEKTPLELLTIAEQRREKLRKARELAAQTFDLAQKAYTEIRLAESDAIDDMLAARAAAGLSRTSVRNAVQSTHPDPRGEHRE